MLIVFIAFISILLLIITHELGHFLLAKKFGIKVEEFGIGYPPRLLSKKIGETVYSLNLIPFGAFVRIYGHEKRINNPRSFSSKPIWQRAMVILGGVVSFWIIAAILLSVVAVLGVPSVIDDNEPAKDAKVQILALAPSSPAESAGLKIGDVILKIKNTQEKETTKISEVQDIINKHKGEEIVLVVKRGRDIFEVSAVPRENPPPDQGPLGVSLVRTSLKHKPWYLAPWEGIKATFNLTFFILKGWISLFANLFAGKGLPQGMEVRGIVGIFDISIQAGAMGLSYFLQFIAVLSVSVAIFNALPIPALDGGWFLFLMIEAVRKKPLSEKVERGISVFFFLALIVLMVLVTIKDIMRFF